MSQSKDSSVLIQIENVRLERTDPILQGINLKVTRGQHWVILGPNGCGKTTLLKLASRYEVQTSGEVFVLSDDVDVQAIRRRIGIVGPTVSNRIEGIETAFEVAISGRDAMINHWGRISPQLRRDGLARLDEANCAHLADRRWSHLSQGERQRVLVARALMNQVDLLALDEPCAGLDPIAREEFLGLIQRVADQRSKRIDGTSPAPSMLMVTHHVEEIVPAFTHALVLSQDGKTIAQGPVEKTIRSAVLSQAFGAPVTVRRRGERYTLTI